MFHDRVLETHLFWGQQVKPVSAWVFALLWVLAFSSLVNSQRLTCVYELSMVVFSAVVFII